MEILAHGLTDTGLARKNNEDSLGADEELGLYVVCDGVGGHSAGEVASRMAVDLIVDHIRKARGGKEPFVGESRDEFSQATNRLASAIRFANQVINKSSQDKPGWREMGTTVVAALFFQGLMSIAHVGDSRIYLYRSKNLLQLTDDHSVVSEQLRMGLITEEAARVSNIKNMITRALGKEETVEVDLDEIPVEHGDQILLCSDGLCGMVSDEEIARVLESSPDPVRAAHTLVDLANENGGKDNITVYVIQVYKHKWLFGLKKLLQWVRR